MLYFAFRCSSLGFPALLLVLLAPSLARAAAFNVPTTQYPTIQSAVNAAASGDTVLIADGTYTGPGDVDVDFGGKNLTVTSVNGAASTIIDCGGSSSVSHRGFNVDKSETAAVISGLTIENADTTSGSTNGGAIFAYNVGLTVENCILKNNTAPDGGGISNYNYTGALTVSHCLITGNTAASGDGGGIFLFNGSNGSVLVTDCTITNNAAPGSVATGGGIANENFGGGTISVVNCTLAGNSATYGGGAYNLYAGGNGPILLTNCTFTNNTATYNGGGVWNDDSQGNSTSASPILLTNDILYNDIFYNGASDQREISDNPNSTAYATVTHCDVEGGYAGTGNLNADPLFVNAPADLHLQPGSPCRGAGTPEGAPATDKDGNTRPDPPSIGAYEMQPATPTAVTVLSVTGSAGQTVPLSATLKTTAGAALSGETVGFSVDGTAVGKAVTNASGVATLAYTLPASLAAGSHTLAATFNGDSADAASSGTGTLSVVATATTLSVSGASGSPGSTVTLRATLKRTTGGTAIAGETVTFSVDGATVGTAVTNGAGLASLAYTLPTGTAIGSSHQVGASFGGDGSVKASAGSASLTVTRVSTTLPVGAAVGSPGRTTTLKAILKRTTGGAAVSGEAVGFSVDGSAVGTAITNTSGLATLAYAIPAGDAVGSHPITVTFAGDATYLNTTGKGTLTVKNVTALTVANVAGAHGTSVTLTATLTAGGVASPGKSVSFKVNGAAVGAAVTDANGVATLPYAIPATTKAGTLPISASFAGDAGNNPTTGAGTLTVR